MRTQRGVVWPYLLLGVALVGALSFGWYQTRLKNQLALDAENKYMSAFHKLKWTSENIEDRTARLMATNDPQLQESLLADLRVYSAQAVEHMAVLPLLTTNTPRIESFLNTLREQSDLMHNRINQGQALSPDDWTRLTDMRKQSVFFESELGNMLGLVGNGMIRWRDTVRVTGPTQSGTATTPITKSVAQLETALTPPPGEEQTLSPEAGPLARPRTDPGPRVDAAAAVLAVKKFVDMPLKSEPVVTGTSDPTDEAHTFSLYFVNAVKQNNTPLNFGISVHGGHVIYMLDGRPVSEKRFTVPQLVERARQMLEKRGYHALEYISSAENDGTLIMDFAPMEQGAAVMVDNIKIMLAMDNGELVGFDAKNYWINRHSRKDLGKPQLNAGAARGRLAPRLKAEGQPRLALIADRRSRERLVWEFAGAIDQERFRVFVDANTGAEVDVQRITGDPSPPLNKG
ncbi:MAG TPA: PepSY1/2 domain-containing protein [Symbiobacteriaceae bacterium]|nr:PepSY1/2 domain-containing protein [Symbiobacteriaceae bacterium]